MKLFKPLLVIVFLVCIQHGFAQVGIGTTTPDNSATLDITSTDGGVLIPRISLIDVSNITTPINNPATGLLVYNTNASVIGGNNEGFYYFNGTIWAKFEIEDGAIATDLKDIGVISAFPGSTYPNDMYLPLDGGTFNDVDYPEFATFITNLDSDVVTDNGNGTFTLADWNDKGIFLRGQGGNAGSLGTLQNDATSLPNNFFRTPATNITTTLDGSHDHNYLRAVITSGGAANLSSGSDRRLAYDNTDTNNNPNHNHTVNIPQLTITGGDSETRPINRSITWVIKVKPSASSVNSLTINNITDIGTDDQNLSISGNTLTIEDGNAVTLPDNDTTYNGTDFALSNQSLPAGQFVTGISAAGTLIGSIPTDFDNQNISGSGLSGTDLTIGIQNGTSEVVDLSSLRNTLDQAYDQGGAGSGSTIDATDGVVTITGEDGLLVTGTHGSGDDVLISGEGTRMFFNPKKAAFRAGRVDDVQWDNDSIGSHSVATGRNTKASGDYSIAMGDETTASGNTSISMGSRTNATSYYSTAMGRSTTASGVYSTAMGLSTIASGSASKASGYSTTASGEYSTAMGAGSTASGEYSTAMGTISTASGEYSTAIGRFTTASGAYSIALGLNTQAPSYGETSIGYYNTTYVPIDSTAINTTDKLFSIGNGVYLNRSNALTIYKSGLMNINDSYNMPLNDGTINQIMATDGTGVVSFVDASSITGNTLDQAYDQGGTGVGRIITADNGAVEVIATNPNSSGLIVSNDSGSGGNITAATFTASGLFQTVEPTAIKAISTGQNGNIIAVDASIGDSTSPTTTGSIINYGIKSTVTDSNLTNASTTNYGVFSYANGGDVNWAGYFGNPTATGASITGNVYVKDVLQVDRGLVYRPNGVATTVGNILQYIDTNGGLDAVDPSTIFINTDNQNISGSGLLGTDLTISIENGTSEVIDLSALDTGGDITNITAGAGLIGGGTTGAVTLTVASNNGLNVDATADRIQWGGALIEDTTIDFGNYTTRFNLTNSGDFIIQDNNSGVVRIDDAGNTTISRSTTWKENNINGTIIADLIDDNDDGLFTLYEGGNSTIILDANGTSIFNEQGNAASNFRIESFGNENMLLIDANFNRVGIGGIPDADLHVYHRDNLFAAGLKLQSQGTNNHWWRMFTNNTNGHLYLFSDDGGVAARGNFNDVSGVYSATSDRRLKKDFKPLPFSWQNFMDLETLSYLYKSQKDDKRSLGLVAQDVELIYPELVNYNEEGDVYHLNYSGFGVVAIKAVQELKNEVDTLKQENAILKAKLNKLEVLEARLTALEAATQTKISSASNR